MEQEPLKKSIDMFLSKPKENEHLVSSLSPNPLHTVKPTMMTNKELVDSIMNSTTNQEDDHVSSPNEHNDESFLNDSSEVDVIQPSETKEYTIIIPKKSELDDILYQPDYFHSIGFDVDVFLSNDERNANGLQSGGDPQSSVSMPYRFFSYFLNQRLAPIPLGAKNNESVNAQPSLFTRVTKQIQELFNRLPDTNVPEQKESTSIAEKAIENAQESATGEPATKETLSWIIKIKCKTEPILIENADAGKLIYEEREDVLDEMIEQLYHQKKYAVYMKSLIYKIDDRYILLGECVKESDFPADFFGTNATKPGTKLSKYLSLGK